MRRYQVYLNPKAVSVLDEFEKYSFVSEEKNTTSKLLRSTIIIDFKELYFTL